MTAVEFTNMVEQESAALRPAAMHLTRNHDDAQDLLQETILKALSNREKFRTGTNLKAWLFTIMRNTFINHYHKITRRSISADTTEMMQFVCNDTLTTRNDALAAFVMQDANAAIAQLHDEFRVPFMMYYVGYKYLEIAEKLSMPIGTVKNRIHLARKQLKQGLQVYAQN